MPDDEGEDAMIRVFVADDHPIVREGLARILDAAEGISCVGSTGDPAELLERAVKETWDVLILDLSGLGEGGGTQVLETLKVRCPRLPVLIYSMHPEEHYGPLMLRAGAQAYLAKGRTTAVLLEAIRTLASGGRFITPTIATLLLEPRAALALSARETQIVECLVAGKTTNEIAGALGVSASTVSTHLRHIREKTGARSSGEIVKLAVTQGWVAG